ncbi:MAG: anti-sigma factor [Ferruginibacter sp.]|nr:anti-sigma factor [Ferruginibacter sp.]
MNAKEIISSGILELYCMGLTSAAETAEVAAWAEQYPEVAAEIEAIQSGLESYAQAQAVEPAPSVKEKLFAAINTGKAAPFVEIKTEEKATAKVYSISPAWKYAAAASMVLLVGSIVLNVVLNNKYQSANKELASTQNELQQQKDMADAMKKESDLIGDKNAKPFILAGMADVPDADARIYWMKNSGDVYIDPSNLPKPEKGKQYQFWAIVDGVPVSGGMIDTDFEIDGKKVRLQKMKAFGKAQAFAVSLEDAGPEKPAPTKVMAMGKI